ATLRSPEYHQSMIRPGIGLLGYGPEMMSNGSPLLAPGELRPVLRWVSRLVQVKQIARGTSVGYNLRWTAQRDSLIGLVPVGYADGYPTQSDPLQTGRVVAVLLKTSQGTHRSYAPVIGTG